MHLAEGVPLVVAARKCGVHRTTLWRWKKKWEALNEHISQEKLNRPTRKTAFVPLYYKWPIATESARPRTTPTAVAPKIVARVLELRATLRRCAEVIWYYITTQDHLSVSLSSVRRILRRHHCFDGARRKRVRPDNPHRPLATAPGELVQTDTIHHVDPFSGKRLYYYTVVDLFTRLAYVTVSPHLGAGLAAAAVLRAQAALGVTFRMVQADNGPEYSRFFEQQLQRRGIVTRHSRIHRPNDNAFVERFNRTLQEECIGHYWRRSVPLQRQQAKLTAWLAYYNNDRVHLGIQMRTPAEMLQRS